MIDTSSNVLWVKLENQESSTSDAILIVLYGSLAHDKSTKLKKKRENPPYGPFSIAELFISIITIHRVNNFTDQK